MSRFPAALGAASAFAALLVLVACAGGEREAGPAAPVVEGGWVRAMPAMGEGGGPTGSSSAAYFVLRSRSDTPDRLLAAGSAVASAVETHESREEGGVMRMRAVEGIDVPAGGRVELRPGGLHLMLVGLNRSLAEGDSVELTLRFREAGEVTVRLPVLLAGPR
jgi:hypothetical protein